MVLKSYLLYKWFFNGMLINGRLNGLYSVLVDMVLLPF